MRIFVLYRLREGVTLDDYRRWSIDDDQPTLRSFAQITDFQVFRTTLADGAAGPFEIVETIEVSDATAWSEVVGAEAIKALQPSFDRFVDPVSLCILHTEAITQ